MAAVLWEKTLRRSCREKHVKPRLRTQVQQFQFGGLLHGARPAENRANSAMAQILFVQAVHDHRAEMGFSLSEEEISAYDRYFESLPTTMVTLFMSISNGVSWENAMFPLMKISPLWMLCFLFFVSRPPRDAKCLLLVFMFLSLSIMCRYRITVMVWDTGASKLCIVN